MECSVKNPRFQSQLHIYDNIEQVLEYSSFVDALQPTRKSFWRF